MIDESVLNINELKNQVNEVESYQKKDSIKSKHFTNSVEENFQGSMIIINHMEYENGEEKVLTKRKEKMGVIILELNK
jgi:hypothetical protein